MIDGGVKRHELDCMIDKEGKVMCATREVPKSSVHQAVDQQVQKTRRLNDTKRPPTMLVADRMTSGISVISPEASFSEALHLVKTMNLTMLAVYDGKRYVGFIGQSSLREVMSGVGAHVGRMRVREFMETSLPPCFPQDPIREVWTRMWRAGHTHLPVLDDQGKVVGVLSSAAGEERVRASLRTKDSRHTVLTLVEPEPWKGRL